MKSVTANVTRAGDWWAIEVPEVPGVYTQAKRLDQVDEIVRDAVSLMTDIPPNDIAVHVEAFLPAELRAELDHAHALVHTYSKAQEEAGAIMRRLVVQLRDDGLSVRDVGEILDISPQRVSQLEADARK